MELDSKSRFRVKYCPCNKSNKDGKFVPFKDSERFGYCHSCEKTFRPDGYNYIEVKNKEPEAPKEYFEKKYLKNLLFDYNIEGNNFVYFLEKTIGPIETEKILVKYMLGTGPKNSVVFPFIDSSDNIVALKYMMYDSETGKRYNTIWYDETVKNRYKPCLFGLHLIKRERKPIAIVEAEKTACVMTYFHPYYTWLASAGFNGLTVDKFKPLRFHKVHLFPDVGKYEGWQERKKELLKEYPFADIEVSRECELWFEKGQIKKGDDIADFYLRL